MTSSNSFNMIYNYCQCPLMCILPDEFLCIQMFSLPSGNGQRTRSHFNDFLPRFDQSSVQFWLFVFFFFLIFDFQICFPLAKCIDDLQFTTVFRFVLNHVQYSGSTLSIFFSVNLLVSNQFILIFLSNIFISWYAVIWVEWIFGKSQTTNNHNLYRHFQMQISECRFSCITN